MTIVFFIAAAALLVLSLFFMLRPLVKSNSVNTHPGRDEELVKVYQQKLQQLEQQRTRNELDSEQYNTAREELELSLAEELPNSEDQATNKLASWIPWALANSVVVLSIVLYLLLGSPQFYTTPEKLQTAHSDPSAQLQSIEGMVAKLEERLEKQPNDSQGWQMLARSYLALGRAVKADAAIRKALQISPNNVDVLLHAAEIIGGSQNNSLAGEPAGLIRRALEIEPNSQYARLMLGMHEFQEANYSAAVATWQSILDENNNTEKDTKLIRSFVDQAKLRMGSGEAVSQAPASSEPKRTASAGTADITVRITLSEKLKSSVSPTDTLFIYARAASGPPMPLAIERHQVGELPIEVILNDSDSMMEQMKLSKFSQVIVNARISKTGNAKRSSGDFETTSDVVDPKQNPELDLTIDQVIP